MACSAQLQASSGRMGASGTDFLACSPSTILSPGPRVCARDFGQAARMPVGTARCRHHQRRSRGCLPEPRYHPHPRHRWRVTRRQHCRLLLLLGHVRLPHSELEPALAPGLGPVPVPGPVLGLGLELWLGPGLGPVPVPRHEPWLASPALLARPAAVVLLPWPPPAQHDAAHAIRRTDGSSGCDARATHPVRFLLRRRGALFTSCLGTLLFPLSLLLLLQTTSCVTRAHMATTTTTSHGRRTLKDWAPATTAAADRWSDFLALVVAGVGTSGAGAGAGAGAATGSDFFFRRPVMPAIREFTPPPTELLPFFGVLAVEQHEHGSR